MIWMVVKSLSVVTRAHLLVKQRRMIVELVRCISLVLELGMNLVLVRFTVTKGLVNFFFFLISDYSSDRLGTFFIFLFFNMRWSGLFIDWDCTLIWGLHCIWALFAFSYRIFLNFFGVFLVNFIHNFKFVFYVSFLFVIKY